MLFFLAHLMKKTRKAQCVKWNFFIMQRNLTIILRTEAHCFVNGRRGFWRSDNSDFLPIFLRVGHDFFRKSRHDLKQVTVVANP